MYPVRLVLMYGTGLVCVWFMGLGSVVNAATEAATLKVRLYVNDSSVTYLDVKEGGEKQVAFHLDDPPPNTVGDILILDENEDNLDHLGIEPDRIPLPPALSDEAGTRSFTIIGKFLGFTKIKFMINTTIHDQNLVSEPVEVRVQRGERVLDKIFIHVVIGLVVLAYINMGCAIELKVIKQTLLRPVAPVIGLLSQYLFMPLASYAIGYGLFYETPEMWLGLFLTGCSPGGGGSNMWTYLLGGSLDLSVTMTFISTVASFAALPLWVFSLATSIYQGGYFKELPYKNIAMLVIGLVLPLSIGLLIKWRCKRAALFMKRLLKPISILFIIFMMTFGVYANLYIFSFFDWKVAVAGMLLPWLGFVFGGLASVLCRRSLEESIAISIETGVQQTGLSIGILKVALRKYAPLGDVTMVIPVAVATMTPIPLTIAYIIKRIRDCRRQHNTYEIDEENVRENAEISLSSTAAIQNDSNNCNNSAKK